MEFVWTLHAAGCFLANCHVPHELNGWADELTLALWWFRKGPLPRYEWHLF